MTSETDLASVEALRRSLAELAERNRQLETALQTRIVIEQAKGVLSERFDLAIDEAFELLRQSARSDRRNLHELAREVLASRDTPEAIRRSLLRDAMSGTAAFGECSEAIPEHAATSQPGAHERTARRARRRH